MTNEQMKEFEKWAKDNKFVLDYNKFENGKVYLSYCTYVANEAFQAGWQACAIEAKLNNLKQFEELDRRKKIDPANNDDYNKVMNEIISAQVAGMVVKYEYSDDGLEATVCNTYKPNEQPQQDILDLIVVLPDDAEPQVGDVVLSCQGKYHKIIGMEDDGEGEFRHVYDNGMCSFGWGKILERNGRPVIYQSQLSKRGDK